MLLQPVEVSIAVLVQILKVGALLLAAKFPHLFSSIVILFLRIVLINVGFRPMMQCIEHLKHPLRLWLFI